MTDYPHNRARGFAEAAHRDHSKTGSPAKYGEHDFVKHLDDIDDVLMGFGYAQDLTLRAAMFVHDVPEDCDQTIPWLEEIEREFGHTVALIVTALTDVTADGTQVKNRDEKIQLTFARARTIAKSLPLLVLDHKDGLARVYSQVTVGKQADRLANFRASLEGVNPHLIDMYQTEYPYFCRSFGDLGGDERMWRELDKLSMHNPQRSQIKTLLEEYKILKPRTRFISDYPVMAALLTEAQVAIDTRRDAMRKLHDEGRRH